MSADPSSTRPEPGTRVLFVWRKWDGSPHWEHECVYLGSDQWGDWVGQLPGWHSARPGREMRPTQANISLIPPGGEWVLTMNAEPHPTRVYIDVAWNAHWSAAEGGPVGIDMDLDVVDRAGRGIWIDDRDEWDDHRVEFGYPLDVVARLEDVATDLERRVTAHEPPFDPATAAHWLDRLHELTAEPHA